MLLFLVPLIAASVEELPELTSSLSDLDLNPSKRMRSLLREGRKAVAFARVQAQMTATDRYATSQNRGSATALRGKAAQLEKLLCSEGSDVELSDLLEEVQALTDLADSRRVPRDEREAAHVDWQTDAERRKMAALGVFNDYEEVGVASLFTPEDIATVALPVIEGSARLNRLFNRLPLEHSIDKLTNLLTGNRTAELAKSLLKKSPLVYALSAEIEIALEQLLRTALSHVITVEPRTLFSLGPDLTGLIGEYVGLSDVELASLTE